MFSQTLVVITSEMVMIGALSFLCITHDFYFLAKWEKSSHTLHSKPLFGLHTSVVKLHETPNFKASGSLPQLLPRISKRQRVGSKLRINVGMGPLNLGVLCAIPKHRKDGMLCKSKFGTKGFLKCPFDTSNASRVVGKCTFVRSPILAFRLLPK